MAQEEVMRVLYAAASQDVSVVKQAEEQLKVWEVNPGFYSMLLDVSCTKEFDINVRWIAVLYLKNGISKYWRQSGKYHLSGEEKDMIRNKLLQCYHVDIVQVATQISVVIGKIARVDIKRWPQVIFSTLEIIKSQQELPRHRALLTLNQIVKELASKRLVTDKHVFQDISKNIFNILAQLNQDYFSKILQPSNADELYGLLEMCVLLTKVIRKLIIYGASSYATDSIQMECLKRYLGRLPDLLTFYKQCNIAKCSEKIKKLIILLMKILSEFHEHHSNSFLPILENATYFCLHHVLESNNASEFDSFVIHCGNLLRSILRGYKRPQKDTEHETIILSAIQIKDRIFGKECLQNLFNHLVMNFFPLTNDDIEEWHMDPESYVAVEAGETHKFLLCPCMETLFLGLFYEYKAEVIPFLINLVDRVNKTDFENLSHADVLYISAIFKAVGLASYELFSDVDFDEWFQTKLLPVLQSPNENMRIIQQHIVWMIGEWINVKFSKTNRITLYKILAFILSSNDTDLVFKLTACKCLRCSIDDFDFDVNDFSPFVNEFFLQLCNLLVIAKMCDTKMLVLNVVSIMIERVNDNVKYDMKPLIDHLPQLWQISEEHNLLRGAVVNVLVYLVKGLGTENIKMHHITLPIINFSTAVDQPAHVYLLEDGLELWLAVVRCSNIMTDDLLLLYRNIHVQFERASETLETCLEITKAYLLLDADAFLKKFGTGLNLVFAELMDCIKDQANCSIVKILKTAFQLQPATYLELFQGVTLRVLTGMVKEESYSPLSITYTTLVANIIFRQPAAYMELCKQYCLCNSCSTDEMMCRVIDIWLDKTDCMHLEDKKISALALSSMLAHKTKYIFDRFGLILDFCVNVLYDLQMKNCGSDDQSNCSDSLVYTGSLVKDSGEDSVAEDSKQRMLRSMDPVYNIQLLQHLRDNLNEAKRCYGDQLFSEAMSTLDPVVCRQLLSLINET